VEEGCVELPSHYRITKTRWLNNEKENKVPKWGGRERGRGPKNKARHNNNGVGKRGKGLNSSPAFICVAGDPEKVGG